MKRRRDFIGKKEIVKQLYEKTGIDAFTVNRCVDILFDEIAKAVLLKDEYIYIRKFGYFFPRFRKSIYTTTYFTEGVIKTKASKTLAFKVSPTLKEKLKNNINIKEPKLFLKKEYKKQVTKPKKVI